MISKVWENLFSKNEIFVAQFFKAYLGSVSKTSLTSLTGYSISLKSWLKVGGGLGGRYGCR